MKQSDAFCCVGAFASGKRRVTVGDDPAWWNRRNVDRNKAMKGKHKLKKKEKLI